MTDQPAAEPDASPQAASPKPWRGIGIWLLAVGLAALACGGALAIALLIEGGGR